MTSPPMASQALLVRGRRDGKHRDVPSPRAVTSLSMIIEEDYMATLYIPSVIFYTKKQGVVKLTSPPRSFGCASPACGAAPRTRSGLPGRAGNRHFGPLRALRAHTKAPYKY
jgi:hypothetical protein